MAKSITFTALDIGTNSIKGLSARKNLASQEIEILAQVQKPCFGVRNGEVIKPEQVSETIVQVKEELAEKAELKIKEVLVNIGGSHLFSVSSEGVVSVSRADQKISEEDIQRVLQQAKAVNLPSNKEVLEVFPREFIVDGEGGIKNPLGLKGVRLGAKVLLTCIFSPSLENLETAVAEANLQAIDVIPFPQASARAVLTPQQKELGVLLVNIGAGSTGISVFEKGDLIDFVIFPIGSSHITNDIAIGFRIEIPTAEKIKKEFATLKTETQKKKKEKIVIPGKSLTVSRSFLKKIVEARVAEIFYNVQKTLKKISKDNPLPGGVVLTGGGVLLPGIVEFTKQKLKLPCRIGFSKEIAQITDPQFSTCCGLLLSGFDSSSDVRDGRIKEGTVGMGIWQRMKGALTKIFGAFLP